MRRFNGLLSFVAVVCGLFIFSASAFGQEEGSDWPDLDCSEEALSSNSNSNADQGLVFSYTDIIECARRAYKVADDELNGVYSQLVAYHQGQEEKEKLAQLRQAQRDWIKFRDSFCEYETFDWPKNLGIQVGVAFHNGCMRSLTQQQTTLLRNLLENTIRKDE